MLVLLITSAAIESAGIVGVLLTKFPSLPFILSQRAIDLGWIGLIVAIVSWRRASVEAAFDLGVEVGERKGRRKAKPVVLRLPVDEKVGKHLARFAAVEEEWD